MGRAKGEAGHGWTVDWFLSCLVEFLDFLIVSGPPFEIPLRFRSFITNINFISSDR